VGFTDRTRVPSARGDMGQLIVGIAGAAIGFAVGGPLGAQIGYLAATTAYGLLNPTKIQGPRLNELHVQGSSYGRAIPIVYGRMRMAGNGCFQTDWVEHEESSGGKGGGTEQTNYTYTNSFGFAICEGPVLGVIRRWANGKLITDVGFTTNERWPFVLYLGDESQMPDPTIEAKHGAGEVSAMRGIAYEVVTDKDASEFNNTVPNVEYEIYTTAGSSIPRRISTWDAPNDLPSGALNQYNVAGASYSAGVITYGFYEDTGSDYQYTEMTYNIDGTLLSTDGPVDVDIIPGTIGADFLMTAQNAQIAFGYRSGQGDGDTDAGAWFRGATRISAVNNILGSPRSLQSCLMGMQPFISGGNLYCFGTTAISTALATHIARYPSPDVDGRPTPQGTPDAYYEFTTDPGIYMVTADEAGDVWVIGPAGANKTLFHFDADLTLIHQWGTGELPTEIASPRPFSVHEGRLFAAHFDNGDPTQSLAYGWSIDGTTGFTELGSMSIAQQTAERAGRPVIWIGGCYALLNDGVVSMCGGAGDAILGDIVEDLCVRAGLDASQVDVSDLTQPVTGFVIAGQMDVSSAIDTLRRAYFFDAAEVDGQIVFVNRGGDPIAEIPDDDLCAREYGAESPAPLQTTRTPELELPKRVWVNYYNTDQDYQQNTQYATRQVTISENEVTLDLPIVLTDAQALQIANRHLHLAWLEREQFSFATSRKWAKIVPTDVVTVRGRAIRITSKSETPSGVIGFEGVAAFAGQYTIQSGSTGGSGGGFGDGQIPPQAVVATELALLDIPLISPSDHQFGFYAAMGPLRDGPWPGAGLYKSLDDGVTYTRIGETRTPSKIGYVRVDGSPPGLLETYALGDVVDETTIRVVLTDDDAELESCTADALDNGANLCAISRGVQGVPATLKWEICQFRDAVLVSPKVYALTGFKRMRKDSEGDDHADGDRFVLLGPILSVEAPESEIGVELKYKAVTFGLAVADASVHTFTNLGLGRDDYFNSVAGNTPSSIVHHTGTSYTFVEEDRGKLHTFSNALTVTVTCPAALREGWWVDIENIGDGNVVLDPANNLDGAVGSPSGSLTLATNQGCTLRTDGTSYWTMRGVGGTVTTQDEGGTLSSTVTTFNFVGAGVTAAGAGATTTVTIPGGGGTITTQDESGTLSSTVTTIDFVGAGVTASGAGATTTVTIPGGSGLTVASQIDSYTANGTWTKPAGALLVRVIAIGAGGGGAGGGRRTNGGGAYSPGGGGGGARVEAIFAASALGATETVAIGAGGTGGAAGTVADTNGTSGGVGGTSEFGTTVTVRAYGGGGGFGGGSGSAQGSGGRRRRRVCQRRGDCRRQRGWSGWRYGGQRWSDKRGASG